MSEKKIWESIMAVDTMTVEEAIDIVDTMYQERYKVIEEKSEDGITIHINKIDDVKFTNLEFASIRLLREVQSIQRRIKSEINLHLDYIEKQAITSNPTLDTHFRDKEKYVVQVLQKLLKGDENNGT